MQEKRILITGGSGFLGKRLGKKLREMGNSVLLTARNHRQLLVAKNFSGCDVMPVDVTDRDSIKRALKMFQPEVIIHCAATKFVDLAEKDPLECCDINIVGTMNIAKEAIANGVKLVLGISTDKAAPPVKNIYGMSKAVLERLFCGLDQQKLGTKFIVVRYGNVVWSTGSVLPIWRKMIKKEGVLRTSGPDMFRFFFTVDEAVDLVLYALQYASMETGLIISKRMKAAQMIRVAKIMCENIEYLPLRPGDREAEYLIGELELPYTTQCLNSSDGNIYYYLRPNVKKENDSYSNGELLPDTERGVKNILTSMNTNQMTDDEIRALIFNVPEEELK
ncbi:MAG: SDR family NAD(P)-dependent oxidoreductase [Candidatus Saganbacteria bacterium]|nr:SDR family NAD(P)-dependent oxidoreductase [Candidatus Saganbacteria bacterium]